MSKPTTPSSVANSASTGALEVRDALERALEGDFDWEALSEAIAKAVELGCATERDVAAVVAKELHVSRIYEIVACLKKKSSAHLPHGRPYQL